MLKVKPCTISEAKRLVARWHRHNDAPQGGLFAAAAEAAGKIVGVAIIGRPRARRLQDGWTCEVTHLATDGTRNACSILYGAMLRAARALGYRRVVTYTLETEVGASLRAAGFVEDAAVAADSSWSRPARQRQQRDLFGYRRPTGAKTRWIKRWE